MNRIADNYCMNELLRREFVFRFVRRDFRFSQRNFRNDSFITVNREKPFFVSWNEARDRKRIKHLYLFDLFDDCQFGNVTQFVKILLHFYWNCYETNSLSHIFRCEVYSPDFDTRGWNDLFLKGMFRLLPFVCLLSFRFVWSV